MRTLAGSRSYAVILLDASLPNEEGVGLISEMRAAGQIQGAPILILSSDPDLGAGPVPPGGPPVFDWLHRPVDADRLVSALLRILHGDADGKPRVLHVDDDPDVLQVVATAFGARARLFSVETLQEARSALEAIAFDLVILDLGLADGSGLDLLPWLKRHGASTPVVVFSAQDTHPDVVRKVDATLTKSRATLDNLVDTVEALVGAARSRAPETATAP